LVKYFFVFHSEFKHKSIARSSSAFNECGALAGMKIKTPGSSLISLLNNLNVPVPFNMSVYHQSIDWWDSEHDQEPLAFVIGSEAFASCHWSIDQWFLTFEQILFL
jgi:hypothetical protein